MLNQYIDMDTQEMRYVNDSSNTSTVSSSPSYAFPPTPAQSPATALQMEFSNLNMPSNSNSPPMQYMQQQPPQQQIYYTMGGAGQPPQQQQQQLYVLQSSHMTAAATVPAYGGAIKNEYSATLKILEHPVEKFRFRYKSEMHGTHGSLNGASSKRTPKTFPEVELVNFAGEAIIRCSLFQANLESPHSHQLVVRKDELDICDPHDLKVSPERGYVAQFQNMGIIHTAKKFIFDELLNKKRNRLLFKLGHDDLTTKQEQELQKQTEKETKDMNLNQVRLCFEAFKVEHNIWTPIAAPVYTSSINNRKSAQTGELKITRLSIATGTVLGADELILLVEKVSKKNIKVRFYEINDDEECVWEAYAKFREADVHHQYAITCTTPAYKDKDVDHPVDVRVELVRPSDDERSQGLAFRYKPRDAIASRKRRRTCSTATTSGSNSAASSFEVPCTVQEQHQQMTVLGGGNHLTQLPQFQEPVRISQEYNREHELEKFMIDPGHQSMLSLNSEELVKICSTLSEIENSTLMSGGRLEQDGTASSASTTLTLDQQKRLMALRALAKSQQMSHLQRIFQIYDSTRTVKNISESTRAQAAKKVADIFAEHAESNDNRDTLIHDIITNDQMQAGKRLWDILIFFKLNEIFNQAINDHGESSLHCACQHDRAHYIRPLLRHGCDPNLQDRRGRTALHVAVLEGHNNCVDSFLNNANEGKHSRLDLTLRNDEGLTALHLAIRTNNNDIAVKLLRHDKNTAAATTLVPYTKDGNTPLHMAVQQQCLELIKVILECPPNGVKQILNIRNAAGYTAIDIAKNLGTKMGREIHAYLGSQFNCDKAVGKEECLDEEITIKDEEISSSSTEDDEEDNSNNGAVVDGTISMDAIDDDESIDIKEEFPIDEDDHTSNLESILNNGAKFKQLVELLDIDEKWKDLAHKSQMQHLICIWNNASDMLRYIKKKASSIEYRVFAAALAVVDREALHVLQTTS